MKVILLQTTSPNSIYRIHNYLALTKNQSPVALVSPSSGQIINTGNWNFTRSGGYIDTNAGVTGYYFQISTGSTFNSILLSGFITTTGIGATNLPNGVYYWRVLWQTNSGLSLTGGSPIQSFTVNFVNCSGNWNNDKFLDS